jgi:hypothetical protein
LTPKRKATSTLFMPEKRIATALSRSCSCCF